MSRLTALDNNIVSFTNKVAFLQQAAAYRGETYQVEFLETHISCVFLTDQYVYKLKKPVAFDFLNFRTLESRYRNCLEEVQINQELAGDTYLGVVALNWSDGQLNLNKDGTVVDWLVKMRRLPGDQFLNELILKRQVDSDRFSRAAEKLVHFYQRSPPVTIGAEEYLEQIISDIEVNRSHLMNERLDLNRSTIAGIVSTLIYFVLKHRDLFVRRIGEGRIRDCHGDLRPEHICLTRDPVIIDRIEFDRNLRIMDVAEELSFFSLECRMLGDPEVGRVLFDAYQKGSGERVSVSLVNFFKAKRALLRARLSINHLLEKNYQMDSGKWRGRCNAYLGMASVFSSKLKAEM